MWLLDNFTGRPPNIEQCDCLITTAILLDFGPNCLIPIFSAKTRFFRYYREKKNRDDIITHHVHNKHTIYRNVCSPANYTLYMLL